PQRHDPAGLAFCQVPKEQRPGQMVRDANRRRTRQHTQNDDRGPGAQAAHRSLASRYEGRGSAGRCVTSSVTGMEGRATIGQTVWQRHAKGQGLPTNPRWRCPALKPWLQMPLCRLGPPPRSFADDAYDCIMVAICKRIDRIQGCGVTSAPRWQAPLGSVVPDLQAARLLMSVKGRAPTIAIHSASNSAE